MKKYWILGVLSTPLRSMTFALWFTLLGDQYLRQFLCVRESKMQKALGTDPLWTQSTHLLVFVPETFQTKLRKLLSPLVCAKPQISPLLQVQEQIKELERKWGPTEWLILQEKMQSSCSKSAFWPVHRCAPGNPSCSQRPRLGQEFIVSVPWDVCGSSQT